jgi:hypothetical protein
MGWFRSLLIACPFVDALQQAPDKAGRVPAWSACRVESGEGRHPYIHMI